MEHITITILADDQVTEGLAAEHGFSLWIETEDRRILFDTGQGGVLLDNARALGIDLGKTDILVVSHGHYDHTGGIPTVLSLAPNAHIYCHPGIGSPRYSIKDGVPKAIQTPPGSMEAIHRLSPEHLHWVQSPTLLSERIGITGPIPRKTSFEDTGGPFFLDPQGSHADPIEDDLALWIRTNEGLLVCCGCCHAGLVNTLTYILGLNRERKVQAVIGGFHLLNAERHRLSQTVAALRLFSPERIIPCHCTGERATTMLGDALAGRVLSGGAGRRYRF